jgi:uncharacterized protein (TIGR03437 family)
MKVLRFVVPVLLFAVFGAGFAAGQAVSSIVNAASNIAGTITNVANSTSAAGLPNSGIAQGSIFIVYGSSLGPATLATDPNPFQDMSVGGTSMAVTAANGAVINIPMYYTSGTQVAGLLPSNTPVGAGTLTLTYNGTASNAQPITVVANNVGMFSVTENGQGAGIVTYADYSLVSTTKAANQGDTLIIWATGLGPVSGNELAGAQLGVNMPSIPLTVWLGGVQAPVSYQGRSGCCVGEDQIVFTVPSSVPAGCAVPLFIEIGTGSTALISNNTVIAVASGSRSCTPTNSTFTSSVVQGLTSGSLFSFGLVNLERDISSNTANGLVYQDDATAQFGTYTVGSSFQPFVVTSFDNQALGTCVVYNSLSGKSAPADVTLGGLDAGTVTVNGPGEAPVNLLEKQNSGQPTQYGAVLNAQGTYLTRGSYTVTGAGGRDIGKFTASFTIGSIPAWTNPTAVTTVTRTNGLTVTWPATTAIPYIEIDGASPTDSSFLNGSLFSCTVSANAGTFTVPATTLLALPTGPYLEVLFKPVLPPTTFSANGLELGSVSISYLTAAFGTLQ